MNQESDTMIEELAEAICRVMELQYPERTRLKWADQSLPAKAAYRRRALAAIQAYIPQAYEQPPSPEKGTDQ